MDDNYWFWYHVVDSNGKELGGHVHQPCFGAINLDNQGEGWYWLNSSDSDGEDRILDEEDLLPGGDFLVFAGCPSDRKGGVYPEIVKWVVEDSPYANLYPEKNVEALMERCVVDATYPVNQVMDAAFLLRNAIRQHYFSIGWKQWMRHLEDPFLSYIFNCGATYNNTTYPRIYSAYGDDTCLLNVRFTKGCFQEDMFKGMTKDLLSWKSKKTFKEAGGYVGEELMYARSTDADVLYSTGTSYQSGEELLNEVISKKRMIQDAFEAMVKQNYQV